VRTGRHFVGYDTYPQYAAAAMERVAGTNRLPQVQLAATDSRNTDPVDGGWAAKDLARAILAEAGFTDLSDESKVLPGVQPTLSAKDHKGRRWWFEVVGGRTTNRPGAQRIELLWRAIAKASVVHEADPNSRFGVLTVGLPPGPAGGRALDAVTGPKKPVAAVVDIGSADCIEQLRGHGGAT